MEAARAHKIVNRAPAAPAAAAPAAVARVAPSRGQINSATRVSSPNDPAEKEARSTAQGIMRMTSAHGARFADAVGLIQQRGTALAIARRGEGQPLAPPNFAADIAASKGSGAPLPPSVREFMEPRFGADFSGVRIHTGDKAGELNRQVSAEAFTVGDQIFFARDRFRPHSPEGKELIAHELSHTLQQSAILQRRQDESGGDGKRMYRTSDGKDVELPPDMTEQEAAKLEAEGKAAEKKLGKGPPPRPVPDAKKLAKKGEKGAKSRPAARGKKGERSRGKGMSQAGAAAAMLKAVGGGPVARYLVAKGAPVLVRGLGTLRTLRANEQTHDDAGEKLQQSEKAVVIPPSEDQSKGNAHQVETVESRPAPVADDSKAKGKLADTLAENIPRNIEDVDNFKRDMKAQHMGAEVMKVVQGDKNAVTSTFEDVTQTPPPVPSDHVPGDLPPVESAPSTAAMNLGQGAVAPLQKEHTDVSNFTKAADSKLKEEGVTQEQLDMVDSGDLAQANKEKKGLEIKAKAEPLAIQKFATGEAAAISDDLQREEKVERDRLKAKRRGALGTTAQKQKVTRSALEKKREEVAAKINGIYKTAQDSVKKKLANLETESMRRFDEGNANATKAFEDNVKRELDAYKADRYSGWFGWARKAKDWLLGMDQLPRVKAIFVTNREAFVKSTNRLVEHITADHKRVIQECKNELADARKAIKDYVDKLGPDLKDIGNKAAGEMNDKLNDLDQFVSQKEEELKNKLKDKQTAAIKAIDEKIEKMKEAMSGALSKLGKLLLLAAKKFFTWALEKVGFSLSTIEGIINKGIAVLKAIFTAPIQFVKRLISAAGTGFLNFGKNFLTHLKNAVFEWLTGSLEGIVLPESWTFKGIVSVVFQMLGLTYQNIRTRLVKVIPEPVVKTLETTFTVVKTLVTEGPMAAWEQLKEIAGDMKESFVEAVKDWVKSKLVQKAIETVLALFIPGAGIIRAIIGIYDTIVFFIQKAKDIMQMIGSFLGSISEIAAGNIGAAASALEEGLARGLKLVINFLARFLRMTGITEKIREAIQKVRSKVESVIDKVVAWIVAQARKLGRLVAQAGVPQDPNERVRLAARAAVAAARRLTGPVTRPILAPLLTVIKVRYGLQDLQPYEQNGNWWVRATINPTATENTGALVNPADSAQPQGVLDLYRGIYLRDKIPAYHLLSGRQLEDQLIREEDFADAVYTLLGISRVGAPSVSRAQRQDAARRVREEVMNARSIVDVKPWWQGTKRPNLFLALLQRFVNARVELQRELKEDRASQLSAFTFTDLPFISTTKNPDRAAQYALATVVATGETASVFSRIDGKIVGKVFVYLFRGNDLVTLQAADIRYLSSAGLAPHARYSKADKEVAFAGSIPAEHRVGEVVAREDDSIQGVSGRARSKAQSEAASKGGLIPWNRS